MFGLELQVWVHMLAHTSLFRPHCHSDLLQPGMEERGTRHPSLWYSTVRSLAGGYFIRVGCAYFLQVLPRAVPICFSHWCTCCLQWIWWHSALISLKPWITRNGHILYEWDYSAHRCLSYASYRWWYAEGSSAVNVGYWGSDSLRVLLKSWRSAKDQNTEKKASEPPSTSANAGKPPVWWMPCSLTSEKLPMRHSRS